LVHRVSHPRREHASTRTTQLYDRRRELVEPDEIERVKF
jgi:hypothetical protein